MLQDFRYALRVIQSKRGVTAVALLALALGIGANTALFSVLYAVLWRPLPYREPDRLAIVWESKADRIQNVVNPANFSDWKERNRVFQDMAAFITLSTNLTGDNRPEEVSIQYVTPNIFSVLGVRPFLGRNFNNQDGVAKDSYVVMLSYGLWKRRYNADRSLPGKEILVNGRKVLVAGVMPEGFGWFIKPAIINKPPELWSAYPITPDIRVRRGRYLSAVARLKDGVTIEQARANMHLVAQQLEKDYHDFDAGWSVTVVPLREQLSGDLRKPLWVLCGAVAFVLLIACTNVANLMLSRSVARGRELALRSALGADRTRIIRQLLTESILLAVVGGAIGTTIAAWGTDALAAVGQRAGMDFEAVKLNLPVLGFALLVSVITGLLFGIVPSLIASKWNLTEQLNEGGRAGTGIHIGRVRNILVATQLSIALVLLVGATLLIQSFWRLTSVDPGFDGREVLTFRIVLPGVKYTEDAQRVEFFRSVVEKVQSIPGVKSTGMVSFLPFARLAAGTSFTIQGKPDRPPGQERMTNVFVVDNGFFRTLKIPLKTGRLFLPSEMQKMSHVVLVNEALVHQYFNGENPLGHRLTISMKDENLPCEIIGIVGDAKNEQLDKPAAPAVFWPMPELAYNSMTIVARTSSNPLSSAPSAVKLVHAIDPDQPVADIRTLDSWLDDSTASAQFSLILLAILAGVAVVLAGTGIFGVMSHAVVQRTRELGIRMALGADRTDITGLVLKEGARTLLIGSAIGCVLAFALTRFLRSMLFETSPLDPVSLFVGAVMLMGFGMLACWLPSRRAANIDPIEALRYE